MMVGRDNVPFLHQRNELFKVVALRLLLDALIAGFGDAFALFIVGEVILEEFFEVVFVVEHAFDAILEEVSYL